MAIGGGGGGACPVILVVFPRPRPRGCRRLTSVWYIGYSARLEVIDFLVTVEKSNATYLFASGEHLCRNNFYFSKSVQKSGLNRGWRLLIPLFRKGLFTSLRVITTYSPSMHSGECLVKQLMEGFGFRRKHHQLHVLIVYLHNFVSLLGTVRNTVDGRNLAPPGNYETL